MNLDIREVLKMVAEARSLARAEERERVAGMLEEEAVYRGADYRAVCALRYMADMILTLKD